MSVGCIEKGRSLAIVVSKAQGWELLLGIQGVVLADEGQQYLTSWLRPFLL